MVHGIEERYVRGEHAKIKEGQIILSVKYSDVDGYIYTYRDDGQGIDYDKIRAKMIEKDIASADYVKGLSERDLLKVVFKHGFSMAAEANLDAGRGVGLPLVIDRVKQLGGRINAASSFGKGFVLKIILPRLHVVDEQQDEEILLESF